MFSFEAVLAYIQLCVCFVGMQVSVVLPTKLKRIPLYMHDRFVVFQGFENFRLCIKTTHINFTYTADVNALTYARVCTMCVNPKCYGWYLFL